MNHLSTGIVSAMERLIAALALIVLSPVLLIAGLLVRIDLGSPVLFRQTRTGKNGVPFKILKFRTMRHPDGEQGVLSDSERVTRLAQILRKLSIDELPQLINVLLGHMSLVGPRPLPVHYETTYSEEESRRHEVKPGMTGWAQVHGRNNLCMRERLALDTWYVDHRSSRINCRILASTIAALFKGSSAASQGYSWTESPCVSCTDLVCPWMSTQLNSAQMQRRNPVMRTSGFVCEWNQHLRRLPASLWDVYMTCLLYTSPSPRDA